MSDATSSEEGLQNREHWLASALEAGGIATFVWGPGRKLTMWSRELEAVYGFPPGGYDGTFEAWLERVHPDDRERAVEEIAVAFESGRFSVEFRSVWPDGSVHWLQCRGRTHFDESGGAVRVFGVIIDVSELKRSQAALQRSEERFAGAFRSSPDAMAISRRADGCLLEVNDRWTSLFEYTPAEAIGRVPSELGISAYPEDRRRVLDELEATGAVRACEVDLRTRARERLRVILSLEPVHLGGESCLITIIRDVTEQRRAEAQLEEQRQQLAHLNRVTTVGALSSTLAHELHQPLAAILANVEAAQAILVRDVVDSGELRAIMRDIANANHRASAVITGLRTMIQRRQMTVTDVNVEQMVADVLEFAHGDLAMRRVAVQVRFDGPRPTVLGDRTQIQQVLFNLILNACDAMAAADPPSRQVTIACASPDAQTVQISIGDKGHGITADAMPRLFEPLFTSKENGLGLGLPISRMIVDAHGGRIWAENNPDGGATFNVALPQWAAR